MSLFFCAVSVSLSRRMAVRERAALPLHRSLIIVILSLQSSFDSLTLTLSCFPSRTAAVGSNVARGWGAAHDRPFVWRKIERGPLECCPLSQTATALAAGGRQLARMAVPRSWTACRLPLRARTTRLPLQAGGACLTTSPQLRLARQYRPQCGQRSVVQATSSACDGEVEYCIGPRDEGRA